MAGHDHDGHPIDGHDHDGHPIDGHAIDGHGPWTFGLLKFRNLSAKCQLQSARFVV